jgi:ABC-type sugar transport system ATPase subunit
VVVSSHRIHELAAVCDRCHFITAGRTLGSVTPAADLPHDARVAMLVTAFDKLRDHWRDRSASHAEAIL